MVKYEVEILLNTPDKRLRSGMSAKCTLDVIRRDKVLVVPKDFVGKDDAGYFVNKEGDFAPNAPAASAPPAKPGTPPQKPLNKTRVKVGAEGGAQYEILEGLKEGDKLVHPQYTGPERKGMMQMGPDDQ